MILYRGGVVATALIAGQQPPDALLTVDRKIAWIGSSSDPNSLPAAAETAEVIELEGAVLTPAFHDAHLDVIALGRSQEPERELDYQDALHAGLRAAARAGIGVLNHHDAGGAPGTENASPDAESVARNLELIAQLTAEPTSGYPLALVSGGGKIGSAAAGQAVLEVAPSLTGFGPVRVDGSLADHSAALTERYFDLAAPSWSGADPGMGELLDSAAECAQHLIAATQLGRSTVLYARGDRALEVVIAAFRAAEAEVGAKSLIEAGHRVVGADLLDAQALSALVEFGIYVLSDPREQIEYGEPGGLYERRLGPVRAQSLNPWADLITSGVELLFGSFAPLAPLNPWGAVRAATQHQDRGQRLTMVDAFGAHTGGNISLEVGAPATFAVWEPVPIEMYPLRSGTGFGQVSAQLPLPAAHELGPMLGTSESPACRKLLRSGVECF